MLKNLTTGHFFITLRHKQKNIIVMEKIKVTLNVGLLVQGMNVGRRNYTDTVCKLQTVLFDEKVTGIGRIGLGHWYDKDIEKFVSEPTYVLNFTAENKKLAVKILKKMARIIFKELNQWSFTVMVNDRGFFVTETKNILHPFNVTGKGFNENLFLPISYQG